MTVSAARSNVRVTRFVRRLEPRADSIATVVRATGAYCDATGLPRPSYEQIRLLVHGLRDRRQRRRAALQMVVDVDLRARPPSDLRYLLGDARDAPRPGRRQL